VEVARARRALMDADERHQVCGRRQPHKLAHPADASRPNLADALGLLPRLSKPEPFSPSQEFVEGGSGFAECGCVLCNLPPLKRRLHMWVAGGQLAEHFRGGGVTRGRSARAQVRCADVAAAGEGAEHGCRCGQAST
jgi:hypothetical protein